MRKKLVGLLIMTALIIPGAVFPEVLLCPMDCEKLNPEALEHYRKAEYYIDRVYWKGALEELRKAAKADPNHVNLHLLLAKFARQRARLDPSLQESQMYYSIAENALMAIEKREDLTKDQQAYLENSLETVKREKAFLEQRERQRMEVGYKIIMEYLKDIGKLETPPVEDTSAPAAGIQAIAPATSFSTPGGFLGTPGLSSSPFGMSPNLSGTPGASPLAAPSGVSPFDVTASDEPAAALPSPGVSPFAITGASPGESPSPPVSEEPANPFGSP